jgi:hypothetical protein
VSIDEQPVALPQLYGAPAYARPPSTASTAPRPFDPDALPLENLRTEEERELADHLLTAAGDQNDDVSNGHDQARSFHLRRITRRLKRGS